ncbi:MAG: carboxylating nicotinate-nucleotide diphosphorylase [PVC group bacterium]|nr:carboxylating nicotinate-nucleotide diphosphorylase [PVC group bacterium]
MRVSKKKNTIGSDIRTLVANALAEDIGKKGDITTDSLLKAEVFVKAQIIAKEKSSVFCGVSVVKEIFRQLDSAIKISSKVKDGDFIEKGSVVCEMKGSAQAVLKGERTVLNLLGRLSGIATTTNKLVKKISKYKARILDTRKTTPGLRGLEKYAVKTGGGYNHRFGLFDQVLIKDTHIQIMRELYGNCGMDVLVSAAKKDVKNKVPVEIEVSNMKEFESALSAVPEIIMLDNMNYKDMKKAVYLRDRRNKKVKIEASGNINERNIINTARCGVDYISMGMLTHSIKNIDFSLKIRSVG